MSAGCHREPFGANKHPFLQGSALSGRSGKVRPYRSHHICGENVDVWLTLGPTIVFIFILSHDGTGCDPNQIAKSGALGVLNMRERAPQLHGKFEFDSERGMEPT